MHFLDLPWLPRPADWAKNWAALGGGPASSSWAALSTLARARIDALETLQLDRKLRQLFPNPPPDLPARPVRLAVLASCTVEHLLPAIRIGGLRRGIWIATYTPDFGQYRQELIDRDSGLHRFRPDAVLFALDARHLLAGLDLNLAAAELDSRIDHICSDLAVAWGRARERHRCQVIQQIPLPVFSPLLGNNEHRLAGSSAWALQLLGAKLRARADAEAIDVMALDAWVANDGLAAWHDPALWHRAKQEVHPAAAPFYGDLVGRLLAAGQGRSAKCLVLDLDNTLWGGTIGDDGLAGIKLGQGSAIGEAFAAFQGYARDLARRGVILAVCSKNDEANALEPFERHPEMVLRSDDIACFVANWNDKATNVRSIADRLNIGLDSLVFVDDSPFEREIVRRELPMVAVPELPEDPTLFPTCLAAAGYFEALSITREDFDRRQQYQDNLRRSSLATSATDLDSYLRSLDMEARSGPFDQLNRARIVQLINKTNQFNLTTRRVTEDEIGALIEDREALTLQIRLIDRLGDNGIVVIVIGAFEPGSRDVHLDTWLMSCRVLGRQVEEATLNVVVEQARRRGAKRLIGTYRATAKNGMVRDHYPRLGFEPLDGAEPDVTRWALDLANWTPLRSAVATSSTAEPAAA